MTLWRRMRVRAGRSPLRPLVVRWRHRGLTPADAFVAAYPRSGNTWLRFMLYELASTGASEFATVNREIPDVGGQRHARSILPSGGRLIKTHEPYLPAYRRAVYLVRDPRDVVVSEYHFHLWRGLYGGELEPFVDRFLGRGATGVGQWGAHVRSWLSSPLAETDSVLVLRFEDVRSHPEAKLKAIAAFLGMPVDTESAAVAVENTSLARMKEKEERARANVFKSARSDQRFIRAGTSGGWRDRLPPRLAVRFEQRFGDLMDAFAYPRLESDRKQQ